MHINQVKLLRLINLCEFIHRYHIVECLNISPADGYMALNTIVREKYVTTCKDNKLYMTYRGHVELKKAELELKGAVNEFSNDQVLADVCP